MSFFQSEIMRSFYKTADKKGWVNKDDPQLIRTASKKSLEPSGDLFVDMCRLAEGLREKGYVKQAEALDKKIAAYKIAETHLYRVHDEDGDALIEHAHPEGDFKVEDAADGMGEVEKLTTQQKKILDVVKKQPTGKLAALADQIVKNAEDSSEVAQLKGMLSGLDYNLSYQEVIKAIKDNQGPTYDFINSWYHDFFNQARSWFSVLYYVYGLNNTSLDPNVIGRALSSENAVQYLANIGKSLGINTGSYIAKVKNPAEGYVENMSGQNPMGGPARVTTKASRERAQMQREIHAKAMEKKAEFEKALQGVNSKNNAAVKRFITGLNDSYIVSGMKSDGMEKFMQYLLMATNGTEIKNSFDSSVNEARGRAEKAMAEPKKPSDSISKFNEASRILYRVYRVNPDKSEYTKLAKKNSDTIRAIVNTIDSGLSFNEIKDDLSKIGLVVNTPQDIGKLADQYLAYAKQVSSQVSS